MDYIKVIGTPLYQWEAGRKIQIIPLPKMHINAVHFSNFGDAEALVVEPREENGNIIADIPNILLQSGRNIVVYTVNVAEDSVETLVECTISVRSRAKPTDYVYTETELVTIESEVKKTLEQELPRAVKAEVKEILPHMINEVLPPSKLANAISGASDFSEIYAPTDVSPLPHIINFKGYGNKYFNVYENIIPNTRTIGAIKESNGVTFTEMGDNIIIANGTNDKSGTSNYILYDESVSLPAGNYTIYGCGKGDKTYSSDSPYKAILYVWDSNGDRFDYTCNRVNNSYSFKVNNPIERIQLKLQVAQGVEVINQGFYSILVNEDTKKRFRLASNGAYGISAFTNIVVNSEDKSTITMYYNKDINRVLESIMASLNR